MANITHRQTRTDSTVTYVAHPSPTTHQQLEEPIANNRLMLSHFWSTKNIGNADEDPRHPQVFGEDSVDLGRAHSRAWSTRSPLSPIEDQASIVVTKDVAQSKTV
jgi:hypothetical protein